MAMQPKVIRRWDAPEVAEGADEAAFKEEMDKLMISFPELVRHAIHMAGAEKLHELSEVYVQEGRRAEAVFTSLDGVVERRFLTDTFCTGADLNLFGAMFTDDEDHDEGNTTTVVSHKRKGLPGTLHRISLITHPSRRPQKVIGVTARVGRAMRGTVERMAPVLLAGTGSLLLIGRPGVGKTTVLREMARLLSEDMSLNVVVVDKTCEIAGDGDSPHAAIGSARWMPVGEAGLQPQIMREAVENQSPHVIIVDEISTQAEVEAARTISQRGVRLIATVHGNTLPELINCRERSMLVGGQHSVTLGEAAANKRADKRKSVNKRLREPVFTEAVELHARERWIHHASVVTGVDSYLEGEPCDCEELLPGQARATVGIPKDGGFEYCLECGASQRQCEAHKAEEPPPEIAREGGGFVFGGGGGGGRRGGRRGGGRGYGQRSGECYSCGMSDHYSRECPYRR